MHLRECSRKYGILASFLLIPFAGQAQTIASYVGAAPSGVVNTPVMVSGVPVTLLYNGPAPNFPAQYVTYKQGAAPAGLTTYTTTFPAVVGGTRWATQESLSPEPSSLRHK
jgi:hypothetical protein